MTAELIGIMVTAAGGIGTFTWKQIIRPVLRENKAKREEMYALVRATHKDINNGLKANVIGLTHSVRRIENRIDEIESNRRADMNLQGVAFWESDSNGMVTYVSPSLCKLVGRSEQEIMGANWISCIEEQDKERVFKAWKFSVETRTPFDEYYRYHLEDSGNIYVWGLAFHKIVNGELVGSHGKLEKIN